MERRKSYGTMEPFTGNIAEMSNESAKVATPMGEINDKQRQPLPGVLDLTNRDVNHLNDFLKDVISFNDVIGEPEPGIYTLDRVWVASYHSYTATKFWCYKILTAIFAVPLAIWWALTFACCSFCTIWCCVPCIKCMRIEYNCLGQIWQLYIQNFFLPIVNAFSVCFSRIRVGISMDRGDKRSNEKFDNVHIA